MNMLHVPILCTSTTVLLLSVFTNGQHMCENLSGLDWQTVHNEDFYISSTTSISYFKWMEQFKALENNEFAISNEIPNPVCATMIETKSSNCHEMNTVLLKWYFSNKCVIACNENFGLARSDISETEVYCDFSRNNTLEQPVGSAEWGASCFCPGDSKLAQHTIIIHATTLTSMLEEYYRMYCHDTNEIEEALLSYRYNQKAYTNCKEDPSVCDYNARCDKMSQQDWFICVCNDGFVGNGFDCRRTCIVTLGDGIHPIVKFNDDLLTGGEVIVEGDIVQVKCIIVEQTMQNATCGCDGIIRPFPTCKRVIYIIGGTIVDSNERNTIGVFIPEDVGNSKSILSEMVEERDFMPLAFNYENNLYVVGGNSAGPDTVEHYDAIETSWKVQQFTNFDGNADAFGIQKDSKYYRCGDNGCQYLDILENKWSQMTPMNTPRSFGCSFLIENLWYTVGGYSNYDTVEAYNITSDSFHAAASYPLPIYSCAATSLDGIGYVCGGYSAGKYRDECYAFNPKTNNWTQISSMNEPRLRFGLVASGGFLYALLGYYVDEMGRNAHAEIEMYDPDSNQWKVLAGVADLIGQRYNFGIA